MTPAQELRKAIEGCELPHPMFNEHLEALKRRIDDTLVGFAPKIVPVPGPSAVGKSTLINKLRRDYPETRIEGRRQVPVLIVQVPQSATSKRLPKSVLHALGIQVPSTMTEGTMSELMKRQLGLAGTRVAIFDETSHLVDEGARVPPRAASDWFKSLSDALDMTLILFGIPRLERLFAANEQLRNRACPAHNFRPYDASDPAHWTAYAACVQNYAHLFAAAGYPFSVAIRTVTEQSYLLTGGLIGVLAHLMRELASLMADEPPRPITYEDCCAAAASVNHAGSPHILAFEDPCIDDAIVESAALKQAYAYVLTNNRASVPVRKKSGAAR